MLQHADPWLHCLVAQIAMTRTGGSEHLHQTRSEGQERVVAAALLSKTAR